MKQKNVEGKSLLETPSKCELELAGAKFCRAVALQELRLRNSGLNCLHCLKFLVKAQQSQQRHYNRAAQPREFQPGDRVMVLVPNAACKFLATWQGPYMVLEKIGPVTYHLRQPGQRRAEQLYHVNLLKKWIGTRDPLAALVTSDPVVVDINPHLSAAQKGELQHLIGQFSDVFSPLPGRTNVLQHDIQTPPGVVVRQRPYRVPEARQQAIEDEVQQMLKLGVIEPSHSPWSSPIVMVPKPDGTLRFCNDFRCLNEVSEFDGYPMPWVDELLDRLGRARYISTLDLTKGYWQVPLSESTKAKTAFSTPSGHWQYRTLPFGLHGAPATSQRMMDVVLRPHQSYATAYLDDVVIHSEAWEDHLDRLRRVLSELRRAGLTANPRKCYLALHEAKYLVYQVGRGHIHPQETKVKAVRTAPRPEMKTQVRPFLGLAGYYRCFIPNFSSLAAPLTDLTRKGQPEKIQWTPAAEETFQRIKMALTSEPVLRAPDFSCPFLLQTDASDTGLGAVLPQVQEGEEHPILYISRKLIPAERNYAAVEKEALAIKWEVLELRYYLLGRKFTLVTEPRSSPVDGPRQEYHLQGDPVFFLHSRTSTLRYDIGQEPLMPTQMAYLGSGQLLQVCQGLLPTHPLFLPYCLILSTGPGRRLGGGGRRCDERPEDPSASPWKWTSHTCTSSSQADHDVNFVIRTVCAYSAQMSGVNDDHYVHYYIQQHNTSIAQSETFLPNLHPCSGIKTWKVTGLPTETVSTPGLSPEYLDLAEAFSKAKASRLPPHRANDCTIDLLPGSVPPKERIFPLSQPESEAMKAYIEEELAKGFIRPSTSPASAGVFFVKKKDGGLQSCIHYCGLNEITVKFRYPLQLVPAALEQLHSARFFTKLDLPNAYNLIRIYAGDEWKTAFSTTTGHYEYSVMPFGLTPGTYLLFPCAFYSRKLTSAEQKYDVCNRELLAIKAAFEKWRHWLEGAKLQFIVLTDHRNLE
ncbi:Retrovirus-related Pol polyprotein [Labeo rohita]|uniref:ribonuclease H n=1 Tax=Labeo rohita TaxID=84645 RepID=A0ABQ8L2S3_LABRO|nr:Retrovirus-related Pol polyprotein [Labeo rohita]